MEKRDIINVSAGAESVKTKDESPLDKRARLITRYIRTEILGKHEGVGKPEIEEIKKFYANLPARERADILYGKLMAYVLDKKSEKKSDTPGPPENENNPLTNDPYLISEIEILLDDLDAQKLFAETYGEARIDAKNLRGSKLGELWHNLESEYRQKNAIYGKLEQDLHLNRVKGRANISAARSKMMILAEHLSALRKRQGNIERLNGFSEIAENTDTAAMLQFEKLKTYKEQLDGPAKFTWLPTRIKIHQNIIGAILNHRWPVLIGEAGTGKSQQANAAALELTGYLPTKLKCESSTGERQMIEDIAVDPVTRGSYKEYGPIMQAYTGFEDSRQQTPVYENGRIVRFDESGRLGAKAYSIIKEIRQLNPGELLNGKKVLPGASAIWTSNPVGPRYPDRRAPDPAMRRELAEIFVDYPDMSNDNPELYEFALAALMDDNFHISADRRELAPAYVRREIPAEDQYELDGGIVTAKDELVGEMSDMRHGTLWRFSAAVKALQDSFINGNADVEKYPSELLRYKEIDGHIEVSRDGTGEVLTLMSSTITLGELSSWLSGFDERRQKRGDEYRVDTLSEWLDLKLNTYLNQVDKSDKEKSAALFRHFGFPGGAGEKRYQSAPLTPKEIGYLSPRAPRPVYVKKTSPKKNLAEEHVIADKPVVYDTKQVILDSGKKILMKAKQFSFKKR